MDVGVVIDQYEIIEHIGRGGMADVWSARDQKLNRMVAIKTIAQTLSSDSDPVDMFKQEAQTIAQMEHPHILPIYDFGEFEGQLYIVMRYVAGGSLEDLLRRGPVPLNESLRLGQAIAQALDHAHLNNVIHLDLKPPNVLLDSHQSPYLADFGLATALDPEGKAINPGSGTLLYMAPEQLTAETIDHRADIYSFSVVMFHILSGQLPFDSAAPLALKQIQFYEELPDVDSLNTTLPSYFSNILRRGTAVNPEERPATLIALIDEMREVLAELTSFATGFETNEDVYYDDLPDINFESSDMELLEAVDIYSRARHNWAEGNGRFLLGVTHFMLMNSYYMNAEMHGMELDIYGKQMILRGALEYDHEIDFWWNQLDDENSRWVCLHALRSGNAPARVRSLYRLETIKDSEKPQIPRLVAQALQVETNEEARMAALQVLGTPAKLMKREQQYDIKTEYRGRMLTTMTRIGIQVNPPHEWIEVIYTPEIDSLIAEIALDRGMPHVSEFAARIVGRIRSNAAVQYIVEQQAEGRRGALRALALVRDEAPTLPPIVSVGGRMYAWSANTVRRLTDQPLKLVFRYLAALFGGWLAMGIFIWIVYRAEAIFTPRRWSNSLAVGLLFGVFVASVVILTDELSSRLRGFWPWWVRLIMSASVGIVIATLTWSQFTWLYMDLDIFWNVMIFGGFGLMTGFLLTSIFNLRSYISIPLTAFFIFMSIYVTHKLAWEYEDVPFFSELSKFEINIWWECVWLYTGLGLIFALVLKMAFKTKNHVTIPLTALFTLIPIFLTHELAWKHQVLIGQEYSGWMLDTLTYWGIQDWWQSTPYEPFNFQSALLFYDYYTYPNQLVNVTLLFALLIAVGGHFPSVAADVGSLATLMWRKLELQREKEKPALLPAEEKDAITPAPAAAMRPMMDAADLRTEMDVSHGEFDEYAMEEERYAETEFDANLGAPGAVEDEYPATEMDASMGWGDVAPETEEKDYGATELDVSMGMADAEQPSAPDYGKTELDVSMGMGDAEPKQSDYATTELDVGIGSLKDKEDKPEAPPSIVKSERVDIGTGIRIDDSDSDKAELDVRAKLDADDEDEDE